MVSKVVALLLGLILTFALMSLSLRPTVHQFVIGSYATDLSGRTPNQRFNASRAAQLINDAVIQPNATFSYNQTLSGWSRQKGYRIAPVSYNGILVDEYGGGVCQTSTTLYNAALLAGLTILERHSHTFSPSYAPWGRDAAVAYANVDLRFKNTTPSPLQVHAAVEGPDVVCQICSFQKPDEEVALESKVLDTFPAPDVPPQPGAGHSRSRWHVRGRPGVRVATYRNFFNNSGTLISTQLVSDNTYEPISAAIWAR